MKTLKTFAMAALAAGVAGTALTTSMSVYAQGVPGWGGGHGPQGWHMMGGPRGGMRGSRIMERFDVNGDGVITRAEVDEAAANRFTEMDTSGDGSVDLNEFKTGFAKRSKDMQVRAFQRLDKDGDGTVTEAEFNTQSDRMFARLDRDGNGELEILRGRPGGKGFGPGKGMRPGSATDSDDDTTPGRGMGPGKGMGQGMGQGMGPGKGMGQGMGQGFGPGQGRGQGSGQGGGMRWNDDDGRNSPRWGHHWGRQQGMGGGTRGYMGMGPMGGHGMMAGMFQVFDTDNDGKITREEFTEVRGKLYASADTDKSGSFSLDDFSAIWMTLQEPRVVRMFQSMDTDGDLKITPEEHAERTKDLVERMDRNDDGVLTTADFGRKGMGKGKWHHGGFGPGQRGGSGCGRGNR